jgi:hypothetical protein
MTGVASAPCVVLCRLVPQRVSRRGGRRWLGPCVASGVIGGHARKRKPAFAFAQPRAGMPSDLCELARVGALAARMALGRGAGGWGRGAMGRFGFVAVCKTARGALLGIPRNVAQVMCVWLGLWGRLGSFRECVATGRWRSGARFTYVLGARRLRPASLDLPSHRCQKTAPQRCQISFPSGPRFRRQWSQVSVPFLGPESGPQNGTALFSPSRGFCLWTVFWSQIWDHFLVPELGPLSAPRGVCFQ